MTRVLLLSALVLALASRALGCDSCSATSAVLSTPTFTCQSAAGVTDGACPNVVWQVPLNAGESYEFSLCGRSCPGGFATFDAALRLYDPGCNLVAADGGSCGAGAPLLTWDAATGGGYAIEIVGETPADFGDFTLVYRRICTGPATCADPTATLPAPTLAWQEASGVAECGDNSTYLVPLAAGEVATFTLCPSTYGPALADFDARLASFDPTGAPGPSDGGACGDDGEVAIAPDAATAGTWCIQVLREAAGGVGPGFTMGYRVSCRPPTALSVGPVLGAASSADCARDVQFTVSTDGSPDLDVSWELTPPPGGSATPATGGYPAATSLSTFTSRLQGAGLYRVRVFLRNGCGSRETTIDFDLRDRAAPDLQLAADPVPCGLRAHGAPPPRTVPGGGALPEPRALDCSPPATTGVLSASGNWYDVFVNASNGAFSARTGAQHPVTLSSAPQNVIFGGTSGSAGSSHVGWYFHELAHYRDNAPGGRACVFDPPDTPAEPASVGIAVEWDIEPAPGYPMTLREEVVAFGTSDADAGIRMSLGATLSPLALNPLTIGLRWAIDWQNAGDDGPHFATLTCSPPAVGLELSTEHELAPTEILDLFRLTNNTGSPIFSNYVSTTPLVGFPGTETPDRLVYGRWGALVNGGWNYVAQEGNPGPDGDSAVLYYLGHQPAGAVVVEPGEGFLRSMVLFASSSDLDCSGFTPGNAGDASATVCEGQCVRIAATADDACGAATLALVDSTPGAPPCAGNPCSVMFTTQGTYEYWWEAEDDQGNLTTAVATITVRPAAECASCSPLFAGASGADPDACEVGLDLAWPAADFPSGTGVYNVYRSEVSCADAAAQPPLVTGLAGLAFTDTTTDAGVDYWYLVEAEDDATPSTCLPLGAHRGGAATRSCLGPLRDAVAGTTRPDGVLACLRARHVDDLVTMDWTRARALLPGEHFHLRKAWSDPTSPFVLVNPEGDTSLAFEETDVSARLQFFDLFVADACEIESLRDYPPGLP